jgi:hypothetical protein
MEMPQFSNLGLGDFYPFLAHVSPFLADELPQRCFSQQRKSISDYLHILLMFENIHNKFSEAPELRRRFMRGWQRRLRPTRSCDSVK